MQNNYYQIYLNSVTELAQTLVIKSEYSATKLNEYYAIHAPDSFNPLEPRTWKYYRNICGLYYPTDTRMQVVSLDTQELIEFNITNLASHRATWRAYQFGTRYFKELVAKYPEQEQLILGVLYPCDMELAIEAPEYSILSWPEHLVEEHELSLIPNLSQWTQSFMARWNNTQYRITDDLYEATLLGILYLNLVPTILNLRLEQCHTNEVHSYHITEYLGSHGYLDRFIDSLNRKQLLYFYRNIRLIQRNIGQQRTYGWLIENALTERKIPLTSYSMTHNIEPMQEDQDQQVLFKRKSENRIGQQVHPILHSTETMLMKEDPLAKLNEEERLDHATEIESRFNHSLSNRVKTKVLESEMTDYTDAARNPLSDILLTHWIYLSSQNIYATYVSITNPRTNEDVPLSAKDAYVFALYLSCYAIGIELQTVPNVLVNRFQRIPTPTPDDLLSIVDRSLMTTDDALALLQYQPEIVPVISTEAFYNKCQEIYLSSNHQTNLIGYEEHYVRRGYLEAMAARIYGSAVVALSDTPDTLYANWFLTRNIDIQDFLADDPDLVYTEVMRQATGLDLNNTVSVKNTQSRMIQMMTELSSYSIQFLSQINDGRLRIQGWDVIRVGDINSEVASIYGLVPTEIEALDIKASIGAEGFVDISDSTTILDVRGTLCHELELEIPALVTLEPLVRNDFYFLPIQHVGAWTNVDTTQYRANGLTPVLGIELYESLTPEQRATIPDIYSLDNPYA